MALPLPYPYHAPASSVGRTRLGVALAALVVTLAGRTGGSALALPALSANEALVAQSEKQTPQSPVPPLGAARGAFPRRQTLDAEALRRQLMTAPEVALDAVPGSTAGLLSAAERLRLSGFGYPGPALIASKRRDLVGLPLQNGIDCQLGAEPAGELQALSRKLRAAVEASIPREAGDPRPDPERLRQRLLEADGGRAAWLRPEAVPALLQMLQAEGTPIRQLLVEVLGRIDGPRATAALAVRAATDLSAEVREQAVEQLRTRAAEDYEPLLLSGLRYPWEPVRDHCAEALVALRRTGTVERLVGLLEGPVPGMPMTVGEGNRRRTVVAELVRVNHLSNCVLCHAPSFDRTDLVRGAVPSPGRPLPAPATVPAYYDSGAAFVRADITYLRQDFSVLQAVPNPGVWPAHQRYDYLVRLRALTPQDHQFLARLGADERAARAALKDLTGQDHRTDADAWKAWWCKQVEK